MAQVTKKQFIDKIRQAENVMVITHSNPNLEQLGASIALIDILHHLEKNAVLIHEQELSPQLDYLQTTDAISDNVESLRDFIISFNKDKVDKFRYIQDGDNYDVMLTPAHRQILEESDITYKKGDFNVDLIISLSIENVTQICRTVSQYDQLIHEKPMVNILTHGQISDLDADIWQEEEVNSSLAEMIYGLSQAVEMPQLSIRTSNALLTSMIDTTGHFKNEATYSRTMHIAGELINFGGDVQLIAERLANLDQISVEGVLESQEEELEEATEYGTKMASIGSSSKNRSKSGMYMREKDIEENAITIGKAQGGYSQDAEEHKLEEIAIGSDGSLQFIEEPEESITESVALGESDAMTSSSAGPQFEMASSSSNYGGNDIKPPSSEDMNTSLASVHNETGDIDSNPMPDGSMPLSNNQIVNTPSPSIAPIIANPNSSGLSANFADLKVPDAYKIASSTQNSEEEAQMSDQPVADMNTVEPVASNELASANMSPNDTDNHNDYIDSLTASNADMSNSSPLDAPPISSMDGSGSGMPDGFNLADVGSSYPPSDNNAPIPPLDNAPTNIDPASQIPLPPIIADNNQMNNPADDGLYTPPAAPPLASMT